MDTTANVLRLHLLHSPQQQIKHVSARRCVARVHVFENLLRRATIGDFTWALQTQVVSLGLFKADLYMMTVWKPNHTHSIMSLHALPASGLQE